MSETEKEIQKQGTGKPEEMKAAAETAAEKPAATAAEKPSRLSAAKKKRLISDILLLLCALLLLYPLAADTVSSMRNTRMFAAYSEAAEELSETEYAELLAQAEIYNASLLDEDDGRFNMSEKEEAEYLELLSLPDTDVMAYISIEKMGIDYLPIYHTSSQSVLQSGAGHLEGSSLPIGGEGTHSVISAHAGMAGSRLFTDLSTLEIGDVFTIYVLGEELTYQVDQIVTVLPEDFSYLEIEEGEDYCTLLTCTPIGLNTHRLLVRGTRIVTPDEEEESGISRWEQLLKFFRAVPLYEWIMTGLAIVILVAFVLPDVVRYIRRRNKK